MTANIDDYVTLSNGMEVFDSAGEKVGKIVDVTDDTIVIEKGLIFHKDSPVSIDLIEGVNDDDQVFLVLSKDMLTGDSYAQANTLGTVPGSNGVEVAPATSTGGRTFTSAPGYSTAPTASSEDADVIVEREIVSPGFVAEADVTPTDVNATTVPVYEEHVTPVKRPISRGAVRIQKQLVTENRTITVPVTEERVRITRVETDEPVAAGSDVLRGDTIEIPLQGEEIDFETTVRQTGEVIVEKEVIQHDEQVTGKVRREEVTVEDETLVSDGEGTGRRDV